jgi:hypothetical protein
MTAPTSQTGKRFIVKLSLTLPLSLAQFDDTARLSFRRQMAVVAGLPAETGWSQVNITVQSARRRRLLEGRVAIAVAITMPNATAANAAATALNTERINAALAAVGLPAAQITSAATVTEMADSPTLVNAAPSASARAAASAHLLLLASLLAMAAAAAGEQPAA